MSDSELDEQPKSVDVNVDSLEHPETLGRLSSDDLAPTTQRSTAPPTEVDPSHKQQEIDVSASDAAKAKASGRKRNKNKLSRAETLVSGQSDTKRDRSRWARFWESDGGWALGIYIVCALVFLAFAPRDLLTEHTPYNHFSHLAAGWLKGELHLADGPPAYAGHNDFARFEGRWYITFPPFPALVLLPFVAIAGDAESVRDGQIFLWFAALGPSLLFLALQRLSRSGHSGRSRPQNAVLSLCFAFGTVFFFCALQGTVWFAAHVLSVSLAALYLLFSVDARRPVLAGLAIGLGFMTRAPLLFAVPFFALEALRVAGPSWNSPALPSQSLVGRIRSYWAELDKSRLFKLYLLFSIPILCALLITFYLNAARFGDPLDTGYKYLTVAWQARMKKWGLFHYHYLAKNLGVVLTSLPWYEPKGDVPFRINVHGLALWFTTPLYFWLLWPKHKPAVHVGLWLTVLCVALPTLFYQNSGWAQFGYRFSNDYGVFLFALLAVGMRPMRALFATAAIWGVVVNGFGAVTFNRRAYRDYYYWERSQERLYQKD